MADFRRLKSPIKGPPPGVDPRQMMIQRGMEMGGGRLPPGVQLPKNIQAPPSNIQMPPGVQTKGSRPPSKD
jgi:hypothetical protein